LTDLRYPWETDPPSVGGPPVPELTPPAPRRRGRRPAPHLSNAAAEPPAWLYHYLTVRGPAEVVEDFAAAARGAGVIPWQLDFARLEEDLFHLAAAQPAAMRHLTIAGCRILARQFRERAEAHHARAVARVGQSRACPFDLQALLPIPPAILALGPTDKEALAWLLAHWGTTDRLRQVVERPPPVTPAPAVGHAAIGYGFFTAGETPGAAITRLTARWPALHFGLQPRPAS
jgi:hypothetical protein